MPLLPAFGGWDSPVLSLDPIQPQVRLYCVPCSVLLGFCTYLGIPLCKLREHVGVGLAVPLVVLLRLLLAHGDLQSRGLILGVDFQHPLKVALGQLKLVHEQTGFGPPVQALLVGTVQSQGLEQTFQF